MDGGRILEYDTPQSLLSNSSSRFTQMVDATGKIFTKRLKDIAFSSKSKQDDKMKIGETFRSKIKKKLESELEEFLMSERYYNSESPHSSTFEKTEEKSLIDFNELKEEFELDKQKDEKETNPIIIEPETILSKIKKLKESKQNK